MKIVRKPKAPTRSNPPLANKKRRSRNQKKETRNTPGSDEWILEKRWKHYSRTGDIKDQSVYRNEDIYEFHKRVRGEELERPIVTQEEARGKSYEELSSLAEGHDLDISSLDDETKFTAVWLWVTGQKKMASKMVKNRLLQARRKK